MRRIILPGCFLFIVTALCGQLTLEQTYNYSTGVVKFETLGYKYFLMDVPNSQCRIYNLDHSLFKTINCPVPGGHYLADIQFVSEKLFDSDSDLELTYTYYQYIPTETSYYYVYDSRIIDEYGNELLFIDGARFLFMYKTGETDYKLFAFCYDYSVFPEIIWTSIYSLPGVPVTAKSIPGNREDLYLKAYPNPASDVVRLEYKLPSDVEIARLNLLDSGGRLVRNYQIDGHTDHIALNVNDLSAGIYFYSIEYDYHKSEPVKIVIR